jgi:hypothetical protein
VIGAKHSFDNERFSNQINQIFSTEILKLYDEKSQNKIEQAKQTKLAFSVLTTLGNKAERLVAKNILAQENGVVEVVLPCAKSAFLREFADSSEHQEFEELFKKSRRPILVGKRHLSPNVSGEDLRNILAENWRYIADQSDVLLVIRDEKSVDDEVLKVIEDAKTNQRPLILISGSKISVERGRGLNADAIRGLERFNQFPINAKEQESYIENIYQDLFASSAGVKEESKKQVREFLLPYYARASMIAKKNQKIYQRAGLLVYSFAATAVAAVALGTLVHKLSPWAFGLELLLLMTILITVFWADRNRTHRKWIESRFLAERLRAAQFLAACQTEVTQIKVPPFFGTKGHSDDWTLMAFNEIWQRLPKMNRSEKNTFAGLKNFIASQWLDDQIFYHQKKAEKSKFNNRLLERGGFIIFSLALLSAALHLLFYFLHQEWLELPLTFAAIVLPAVGAAVGGIRTHREFSRLSKRSENMIQSLSELKANLEQTKTPNEFENLLRKIEQTMLIETQDWLMLMQFAELEAAA